MRPLAAKALAVVLSAFVLAGTLPAAADITDRRFEKKTQERLEELGIGESDVRSIKLVILRKKDERPGPEIIGAESWIRLTNCTGYLVIVMNRSAYVRDSYTRGDCSVPGLSNY